MNYSDILYEMEAVYAQAIFDVGLTTYQAFAYSYDEMSVFLRAKSDRVKVGAFTALFFVAVKRRLEFVREDPFTQDVFEELREAYSNLYSLGLENGSDDDKIMLEHAKLVSGYTQVFDD